MTRNSKKNIKDIDYCLNKIDKLSLLKDKDKTLLEKRLILIKKLANKKCFSDDDCEFQIVIYSYSIMEFLAKIYFKINSESYFDIDYSFLPQKIYKNVDLIRKYRHHVHIKDSNDTKVSSDDCISCLADIFKYFSEPNSISFDIVLLLGDADLNNRHDAKLLKSLKIQAESFSKYINAYKILSIPKRKIADDEYNIALNKFIEIFYKIFSSDECTSYSSYLIGRFLYSLTFFKKNDTKELIEKFLKKELFFQTCNKFISYVVELFPDEVINYLKENIKSFSKTTIENSNWLDSLLYSLVVISNDNNIVDVLYLILSFYDNTKEEKILKRATDMLWPDRPQTKATLDKQFNAVFKLFNGSNNLSHSTIFSLLPYLLKGFYKNNNTYLNFYNIACGLFEDGQNHKNEIEKQYDKYYNYIFNKSKKYPELLHILLSNIKSFDNTILYKLIRDINSQFNTIPKTYDVLNDFKALFISLDKSEKGYNELKNIIKALYPELIDNMCIEIVKQFNNKKSIHPCFYKCIKDNPIYYITEIVYLLNNPNDFGATISKNTTYKFDQIALLLLGRKQDKILSFLKGYISYNFNITIDRLFKKAKSDTQKLNLLLLYKFDQKIHNKLIGLKKNYRIIYWQNFNQNMVNIFVEPNILSIIVKNLINVGNFILALEILENSISLNDNLLKNALLLSLSIKLLFIIANNFSIDIKYNWDINYISQNAKIHNKICFLLDKIEHKKLSRELYQIEYIFADRKMDFTPNSTGYYLQKSPCDLILLLGNKNLIALLGAYWDMPPGFSKSNRFYINKFNKWFNEYETIKPNLTPNDIKKVSFLLCHSYANGPFWHPRIEVINKLNELNVDWYYFAYNYIEHLKNYFELHINPDKVNEISDILLYFISFLEKNNYGNIASIIKNEGKEYLSKKTIIYL